MKRFRHLTALLLLLLAPACAPSSQPAPFRGAHSVPQRASHGNAALEVPSLDSRDRAPGPWQPGHRARQHPLPGHYTSGR